jgi:dGTPase
MADWYAYLKNAGLRLGKTRINTKDESRSEFQRDYDRIIFFDAFRRLQNKTQVLPVPKSDVVRNRLTHSLETASVGRSLGFMAGKIILKRYPELKEELLLRPDDFGYMVSAAALAHDIGNPPFGHEGEKAISQFFKSEKASRFTDTLTDKQKADLQNFEGNAAGLRILAHTQGNNHQIKGGLRLSLGTYGAFVKYPKESLPVRKKEGKRSLKKYGIFQSEKEMFEEMAGKLALIPQHNAEGKAWKRYPLVFLTEAADDICYTVIDYEDGFHLGFIPAAQIKEKLFALAGLGDAEQATYDKLNNDKQRISFLRAYAINRLVRDVIEVWTDMEKDIVKGNFDAALTEYIPGKRKRIMDEIISESIEKIYHHPAVLKNEAGGKTVIPFLLEKFLNAVFDPGNHKQYFNLIPVEYRTAQSDYEKILDVVMYVASMTDRQAVDLYRNFNGMQLADY